MSERFTESQRPLRRLVSAVPADGRSTLHQPDRSINRAAVYVCAPSGQGGPQASIEIANTTEGFPMEGLKDKVIVFAGAGGIATAAAERLGAGGARVVVGDVVLASAERTVHSATAAGGGGVATTVDIADEAQVKALIDLAIEQYGRIDGLFNVAANIDPDDVAKDTNVVDIDIAAWQRTIDVNLTGYLLTTRYAIPHMIAAGGGAIVNTSSEAVYAGMDDKIAYAASKAGVTALTRHIARKFGKQNIRSNAVSPGLVLTEQTEANLPTEFRDAILAITPAPRNGKPADIGATVAFLLSDSAEWITGQVLSVNGGTTMRA